MDSSFSIDALQGDDYPVWKPLYSDYDRACGEALADYLCTYSAKTTCYLQDLYVVPTYRNQGAGRGMIEHLAALGEQQGWRQLRWKTSPENTAAQKLYETFAMRDDYIHYTLPVK